MDYKKLVKNRELRIKISKLLSFVPSKPYLKFVYRMKTGRKLNLSNPQGFNEKLNWLKLNDIHPEYTKLVDKLTVREYIKEKLGEDYLFPLLGSWNSFDEIDFDALPDKFVLKCNHDSGSVKIIRDKNAIDKAELKRFFTSRMKINAYCLGREYPYKAVKPCIMAEQFMEAENGLNDYKFFCFNGKVKIMLVVTNRETNLANDFYDENFNHLNVTRGHKMSDDPISKPTCFEKMKSLAESLSQDMRFVRIDFYEVNGKVYFGEFTFFPAGGFWLFEPEEWEQKLGDLLKLPEIHTETYRS